MHLESFVARYGYAAVLLGMLFEGETVLVAGGALAHQGLLSLPVVMGAAFVGSLIGDQTWFYVGRRFGTAFITKRPAWTARALRADKALARLGSVFVVGFRFVYGIRSVTPVFLGARGYDRSRFLRLNVLGAGLWAVAFACVGYALGAGVSSIDRYASHVEEALLGAVVCAALIGIAANSIRRHLPPKT